MADDGSQQSKDVRPLPKCYFRVKWDSAEMLFEEVSGLDMEAQTIEYRAGNCSQFAPLKMPGLRKYGDVTMKKASSKAITNSSIGSAKPNSTPSTANP